MGEPGSELSNIVSAFVTLGLPLSGNHLLATATLCGAAFLEPSAEEMNPSRFSPFSLAGTPTPHPRRHVIPLICVGRHPSLVLGSSYLKVGREDRPGYRNRISLGC